MEFLARMFGEPKEESGTVAQLAILAERRALAPQPGALRAGHAEGGRGVPLDRRGAQRDQGAGCSGPSRRLEPATRLGTESGGGSYLLVAADEDMSTPWAAARRMHEVLGGSARLS
ncbi:hypothetical protein ACFSTC_20775 [Nonomuraea ferruginea]